MALSVVSSKLSGIPHAGRWSQVYEFFPQSQEEISRRGRLFLVVTLSSQKEDLESVVAARKILAGIQEEYFGNLEESVLDRLKFCVLKAVKEFDKFGSSEIAGIVVLKNLIYASVSGGARAMVLRDGVFYDLVKSSKDEVFSTSGYVRSGDLIILATGSFFKKFPFGLIRASFETKTPSSALELLAPSLHTQEESAGVGVLVLKFEEEKQKETSESFIKGFKKISPFWIKEGPNFRKLTSTVAQSLRFINNLGRGFIPGKVYVKREETFLYPRKKISVSVGVLLFTLLIISIFLGIKEKKRSEARAKYEKELSLVEHQLQEAESLFALNPATAPLTLKG